LDRVYSRTTTIFFYILVQVGDRFTVAGVLYEVTTVRPNRRAAVVVEAKAIL
jgi:hypothetical protein